MKLSEHFTKEELIYSLTAKKYKIENEPTATHLKTLKHTCNYLLEPLRALMNIKYMGRVINGKTVGYVYFNVTSGYRSNSLNEMLCLEGYYPSKNSQHCTGEAVDGEFVIVFTDKTKMVIDYRTTYKDIKHFVDLNLISIDQCIQEKQGASVWVHLSYSAWGESKNRKQFFELSK